VAGLAIAETRADLNTNATTIDPDPNPAVPLAALLAKVKNAS
jgi:hypothetical protein